MANINHYNLSATQAKQFYLPIELISEASILNPSQLWSHSHKNTNDYGGSQME